MKTSEKIWKLLYFFILLVLNECLNKLITKLTYQTNKRLTQNLLFCVTYNKKEINILKIYICNVYSNKKLELEFVNTCHYLL